MQSDDTAVGPALRRATFIPLADPGDTSLTGRSSRTARAGDRRTLSHVGRIAMSSSDSPGTPGRQAERGSRSVSRASDDAPDRAHTKLPRFAGLGRRKPSAELTGSNAPTDPAGRLAGGPGGSSVREQLGAAEAGAWAALAAAWAVASETGAPLASSLRELAGALRDDAQLRREVRAALAGPRASAKLVTMLPFIAVGFGIVLGFDTVGVLLGNPLGWACLAVGGALLWLGARWNRALAARAAPPNASPGLELDLLAIAMSSGASIDGALAVTRRAIATHLPGAETDGREIAATVRLATQAGAPVAELLRAEAFRQRRAARADGAVRAAALSVRLMIPLGVCILPAFVLLGVAPLMISVITGTLGGAR